MPRPRAAYVERPSPGNVRKAGKPAAGAGDPSARLSRAIRGRPPSQPAKTKFVIATAPGPPETPHRADTRDRLHAGPTADPPGFPGAGDPSARLLGAIRGRRSSQPARQNSSLRRLRDHPRRCAEPARGTDRPLAQPQVRKALLGAGDRSARLLGALRGRPSQPARQNLSSRRLRDRPRTSPPASRFTSRDAESAYGGGDDPSGQVRPWGWRISHF